MSENPFTSLVETPASVSATGPGAPFDPNMAYLLSLCCGLTYTQLSTGSITADSFTTLFPGSDAPWTASASNLVPFTISEPIVPPEPTTTLTPLGSGEYVTLPAGFGVQLALTAAGATQNVVVVALRGTRTWDEWLEDVEALPVPFAGKPGITTGVDGLGSVHGGFYALYTVGTDGATATPGEEVSPIVANRAPGSLAQQVATYVSQLDGTLPLYVTGFSLGAALATLCALDLAYSFNASYEDLFMYSFASPRVAVGVSASVFTIPTLGNQAMLQISYQTLVPNSYQVVNAADIVPILPPLSTTLGPLTLACAQVTDPFSVPACSATATATLLSNGGVGSIDLSNDLITNLPQMLTITGGGGSGAKAILTSGVDKYGLPISVAIVVDPGAGYTSPPSVGFTTSGNMSGNVINFCAQTGDIGNNHSCVITYIPYAQALAGGF